MRADATHDTGSAVKLVSFVRPNGAAACIGLLSDDDARVADLTAIGVDDVYAALPRFAQLGRLARHLTRAPGAVVYPVGSVRLLAPVPYARLVRESRIAAGAAHALSSTGEAPAFRDDLSFADPADIAGPGAHLVCAADEILTFGVVAALKMGGRDIHERQAAGHIAGVTLFAEWHDPSSSTRRADSIVMGPTLVAPERVTMLESVALVPPDGGVRHAGVTGALASLARMIAAASARYTLRAGDLFLFEAGAAEITLPPGSAAKIVVEASWAGSLAHTAHRGG